MKLNIFFHVGAVFVAVFVAVFCLNACQPQNSSDERMLQLLKQATIKCSNHQNSFSPSSKLAFVDSLLAHPSDNINQQFGGKQMKASVLLMLGRPEEAINILEGLLEDVSKAETNYDKQRLLDDLAIAYLRLGEQTNCQINHTVDACVMPIKDGGIHKNRTGSTGAIELYTKLLEQNPKDVEAIWLLNIACMTLGQYPDRVPKQFLLPNLAKSSAVTIKPFEDIAPDLGLNVNNMAGGVIIEDFDNDGNLDLVSSGWDLADPMHYFKNNGDGTFSDQSKQSRLELFTGGLNMIQTDYNNDGYKDIFVLRGAWLTANATEQPNSLLKNNGDGTFTDVTISSGLYSVGHTQAATWNDFNNDGWLDVYVGNETSAGINYYACQLFINNRNGTFTDIAQAANCDGVAYVKGVNSGDFNNDGWKDIIVSTMDQGQYLLQNKGLGADGKVHFDNVSKASGLANEQFRSFSTWFWDFDNDGWQDILVCDYTFNNSLAFYATVEQLGQSPAQHGQPILYKNNGDGTFRNVTKQMGLDVTCYAMGSNFGDIDNDGYLDFFLGTGNPSYKSLVPNKLFKNLGGKAFADVTTVAKVGNLQKGHGVAFGDLDNDGNQDMYIDMGGAYIGDAYPNSFFRNPGQGTNNWIYLNLEGTKANKAAIGTSIKLTFTENGVKRSIYREVNSGSSFGSSPLKREIGIGQATVIDEIEIRWHGSSTVQTFKNVKPNQWLKIIEGNNTPTVLPVNRVVFKNKAHEEIPMCRPAKQLI